MARHNEIGRLGELAARTFLENLGYQTLEQNRRFQRAEVDLIMRDGHTIVFVEVRTRSGNRPLNEPLINSRKIRFLQAAAAVYCSEYGHTGELRFDFVAVRIDPSGSAIVEHYPDAFFSYM